MADEDVPDNCRFCGKGLTQEDEGRDACEDCILRETDYTRDPVNQPENIR